MIFGTLSHLAEHGLNDALTECFRYASEHDLENWSKGSYPIDGDRLFVNIVEYETTTPEKRFWEAHRQYLDVHLLLSGTEQIDLNFIDNLTKQEYVPADDFLPLNGDKNSAVILRPGDFLICYPGDAHRTAVAVDQPETIKKAIFKVKI